MWNPRWKWKILSLSSYRPLTVSVLLSPGSLNSFYFKVNPVLPPANNGKASELLDLWWKIRTLRHSQSMISFPQGDKSGKDRDVEPSSYILQRTTTSTTAHPALLYTQDARPGLSTSVGRSAFRVTDFSCIPELYSPQTQKLLLREKEELRMNGSAIT